ncbi:wee1-like protein kinase isoform X1 [Papaver somniferum]|uniref:wee1-like protein kinase isoform X1 n=1 Tax=Papaver somniferum TaxID=3469 RepID=UPI000E701B3B|nr:wee1-like protein kinase isoform X1 [Papaver somniferum]
MKKKTLKRSNIKTTTTTTSSISKRGRKSNQMKSTPITVKLGQLSVVPSNHSSSSGLQIPQRQEINNINQSSSSNHPVDVVDLDNAVVADDKDRILSQDFFCTPDYITPDGQQISNYFLDGGDKENIPCPRSPEKSNTYTLRSKRQRQDGFSIGSLSPIFPCQQEVMKSALDTSGSDSLAEKPSVIGLQDDCNNVSRSAIEHLSESLGVDEPRKEEPFVIGTEKKKSYVSQTAVALRCRVMPPPCLRNPYIKDTAEMDLDPFGNRRSKSAGVCFTVANGDGISRYRTDFHEIGQIGHGNFSRVFKVLKRIDGCMYAVKHSIRQLHQDTERRQALMEVQALAALGYHKNVVGYYTSWFENEQLFIQMELCDGSLSIKRSSQSFTEDEALDVMHQIALALMFIHERGIAHLDVKPDNIYVKNGVYKLGDFGCATLLDKSLPIEEGDARYMPREILNDNYDYLDKVDIFSLGAAILELVKGSPLPDSGPQLMNLREGKIPLLPGHSIQFQNLVKVMVDPDPVRRPSARDLVKNPIFDRVCKSSRTT